ncbi:SDR family NAD(P)-dependent oxidoreductase, partial [Streptomyces griseochromogenes]
WTTGTPTTWNTLHTPTHTPLPTYPFQRKHYWAEVAAAQRAAHQGPAESRFWDAVEQQDTAAFAKALRIDGFDRQPSLDVVLPALAQLRQHDRDQAELADWRYRTEWRPVTEGARSPVSGTWLVVVPSADGIGGTARLLISSMTLHGGEVHTVELARDELERDTVCARLREVAQVGNGDLAGVVGVVSLLALDERPDPQYAAVPCGFSGTVALIQALGEVGFVGRTWCVTRGAVSVGAGEPLPHPLQGLVWGLGRVLGLEVPERWGGLIDLPEELDDGVWDRLGGVLAGDGGEDQLAIRGPGLMARRLVRAPLGGRAPERAWTPGGTVLVTGGTGGVGRAVVRWLARSGAEHLLLVSRSGSAAEGASELSAELAGLGVGVTITACDVADRDALGDLLARIPSGLPLTAVFHASAELADGAVDTLTPEQIDRALRAKVRGALLLHELTRHLELSAFVLFSSTAAVLAAPGQGNYAPGNAMLDALAQHRRARGLPATSIAWGAWAGEGMSARGSVARTQSRHGVPLMRHDLALKALQEVLDHDEANVVIANIDWRRLAAGLPGTRPSPLIGEIPEANMPEGGATSGNAAPQSFTRRLAEIPDPERGEFIRNLVRAQVASVLGHDSPAVLPDGRAFREIGFDSVTGLELRNRLNAVTGGLLPASLVFDYPNISALAAYLHREFAPGTAADTAPTEVLQALERLESALASTPESDVEIRDVESRLRSLLRRYGNRQSPESGAEKSLDLEGASQDEVFALLDRELGESGRR